MEFANASVLVTGGGSGLGLACARRFVAAGAHVTLMGRTERTLSRAANELGSAAHVAVGDVTVEEDVARAIAVTADAGPLRGVVHSAGQGWAAPVAALPVEAWRLVVEVNMTGAFLTLKHAAPQMAAVGGGAFVAISSVDGLRPARFLTAYSAAKAGMDMFVQSAANELGAANIRVSSVCPGMVPTDLSMDAGSLGAVQADFLACMPLGRFGTPHEVADAVYFLATADWVTGVKLPVDGGHHLRRAQHFDAWVNGEHPNAPAWWGIDAHSSTAAGRHGEENP